MDGTAETFRDVIKFIYTDEQFEKYAKVETSEEIKHLLNLAYFGHKYEIHSLTNYTNFVINHNLLIERSNVISIMQDIEEYKLNLESEYHLIKSMCYNFMDTNMEALFYKNGSDLLFCYPEVIIIIIISKF